MSERRASSRDAGANAGDDMSVHEIVAAESARIETLFEQRGGTGAGLMQKAERFHYALSERAWDQLCWLNGEGREVALYDLAKFRRVASEVITATEALRTLRVSGAPARRSAPSPGASRPAPTPSFRQLPKSERSRPREQRAVSRAPRRRSSGLLPLVLFAGVVWACVAWNREILAVVRLVAERLGPAQRTEVRRSPELPSTADVSAAVILPSASARAKPLRKRKIAAPRASASATTPVEESGARVVDAGAPSIPLKAPREVAPRENEPREPEPRESPAARPDAGKIRMTTKELDSF